MLVARLYQILAHMLRVHISSMQTKFHKMELMEIKKANKQVIVFVIAVFLRALLVLNFPLNWCI